MLRDRQEQGNFLNWGWGEEQDAPLPRRAINIRLGALLHLYHGVPCRVIEHGIARYWGKKGKQLLCHEWHLHRQKYKRYCRGVFCKKPLTVLCHPPRTSAEGTIEVML